MLQALNYLRTLSYGTYGRFLILGNAGFVSLTVAGRVPITSTLIGFVLYGHLERAGKYPFRNRWV